MVQKAQISLNSNFWAQTDLVGLKKAHLKHLSPIEQLNNLTEEETYCGLNT